MANEKFIAALQKSKNPRAQGLLKAIQKKDMKKEAAFPLALLGAGILGAGAGSAGGLFAGKRHEKKALTEEANIFDKYNGEENQAISQDAFMKGVRYALSGMEGPEKQAFYKEYSEAGFKDELEKIAAGGIGGFVSGSLKATKKLLTNAPMERVKGSLQFTKDFGKNLKGSLPVIGAAGVAGYGAYKGIQQVVS